MFELLEHEHATAFAEQEAVAVAVERTARAAGIFVSCRHRRQEDEAGETKRVDHAVSTPRENHVGRARRMTSTASPIAWALAAQAVRHVALCPRAPKTPAR